MLSGLVFLRPLGLRPYSKQKKIIGDVDIIQNVFTNNSLLYLIKLDQNSMNNLELNDFKFITTSNHQIINSIYDTLKTRFETKNINLNLIYKNIDNTNLKKSFLNEVSTDTVFTFSTNAASQEYNIIAVNFLKFTLKITHSKFSITQIKKSVL